MVREKHDQYFHFCFFKRWSVPVLGAWSGGVWRAAAGCRLVIKRWKLDVVVSLLILLPILQVLSDNIFRSECFIWKIILSIRCQEGFLKDLISELWGKDYFQREMNWFWVKGCKKTWFLMGKLLNLAFISTPRCVILELFSLLRLMGS